MQYSKPGLGNLASPSSYIYYGVEEFEDTYKIKMDTTTTYSIVVSDISVGSQFIETIEKIKIGKDEYNIILSSELI